MREIYRGWSSSTECVGHVSVHLKWSSSVVEWMCSSTDADKLNSSSEEQENDITHQSPDPSMSYRMRFNFCRVYISRICKFCGFCIFKFAVAGYTGVEILADYGLLCPKMTQGCCNAIFRGIPADLGFLCLCDGLVTLPPVHRPHAWPPIRFAQLRLGTK